VKGRPSFRMARDPDALQRTLIETALDAERRQAMPDSVSTLLTRNLDDVFGENNPARRHAAIDEIFKEESLKAVRSVRSLVTRLRP
jgi:hypothetical protein